MKQRTVYQADLASVRVAQGDLDGACQLVAEAATALTTRGYATTVGRLGAFRRSVEPYAGTRAVRELDLHLAAL